MCFVRNISQRSLGIFQAKIATFNFIFQGEILCQNFQCIIIRVIKIASLYGYTGRGVIHRTQSNFVSDVTSIV